MPRRTQNINSLSRGRVRASMNKYNLFNLYKKPSIKYQGKTLFQQKWNSKAETRAYHGEHLTEGRLKALFTPHLQSVAQLDASLKGIGVEPTPMPLQTFAILEKRLEFGVFRSMFASSIRQARQFILGGHVKVNGTVIKHPSFPLRAGDVFSVTPEKVMVAMGRTKPSIQQAIKTDNNQIAAWNKYVKSAKANPQEVWQMKQLKPKSLNPFDEGDNKISVKSYNDGIEGQMKINQANNTRELILNQILQIGKNNQYEPKEEDFNTISGPKGSSIKALDIFTKLKQNNHQLMENFNVSQCKTIITTKSSDFSSESEFKLISSIKQILSELVKTRNEYFRKQAGSNKLPESSSQVPYSPTFAEKLQFHAPLNKEQISEDESQAHVSLPWQKGLFGRQDPSKPYFTPWTPRPFIGAFAVLPFHIEISFATCHAIYLRDPVARPGHSEVISPFPHHAHERAYMYYARKGM